MRESTKWESVRERNGNWREKEILTCGGSFRECKFEIIVVGGIDEDVAVLDECVCVRERAMERKKERE